MSDIEYPRGLYGPDVHLLEHDGKTILLIGTAHVSQQSVDLVNQVIHEEHPDAVCIELDEQRLQALTEKKRWQNLDLKAVIRRKQLSTLLVSMAMAAYQKKLGDNLGVLPGAELLSAVTAARSLGIPIFLCDRDIRITLRRAWKTTSFFRKFYLIAALAASLFDSKKLDEAELEQLKKKDVLDEMMAEMGDALPEVKRILIDERDIYLAEKIKTSTGTRLVAVVGAGHVEGIKARLAEDNRATLAEITAIPPVSPGWKIVGWLVPALIISLLVLVGIQHGAEVAGQNLVFWIMANGIPAAIGCALALAHPFTTAGAFAAAPITSLTPVIGAGYVTAFIQVMTQPPVVREFEQAGADMSTFSGWWRNRLLRVFLVFILTTVGSIIGTYVGGYEIVRTLLS
jgi:pheromone shutdown-related protein TraB